MRIIDSCAKCLYDRQLARANMQEDKERAQEYLAYVKTLLDERTENDCAPYLVSLFNDRFSQCFGGTLSYTQIKREYNDLVLSMEQEIEARIETSGDNSKDRLKQAMVYARVGNYIDFGAMNQVDKDTFLSLFDGAKSRQQDEDTFELFYKECSQAERFLLIADNCGEIVLDKILLKYLKSCFPDMDMQVMVRGQEVLNDATKEDAEYSGIDQLAEIIENGTAVAGTIYDMITPEARLAIDAADVILAKGQGNFESMAGQGRHIFYSFLCKCELFTNRFQVPRLTGIFVSEPFRDKME